MTDNKKLPKRRSGGRKTCPEQPGIPAGEREGTVFASPAEELFHSIFRLSSACMSLTYPDGRFIEV
ncbi:MAG TPA: hypothetical protein VMJ66_08975, partial [Geobacteraceae bacterium]|nr:hypothetical protein [Geobacteraceae bacterium]